MRVDRGRSTHNHSAAQCATGDGPIRRQRRNIWRLWTWRQPIQPTIGGDGPHQSCTFVEQIGSLK